MYQFRGIVLSSVTTFTSEKYLGVCLNHDLNWSHHIDQVAAKAARKLGFVRHNLRGAPVDCKKLAYVTLVRSGMECASVVWDMYTKADSNKLEKIQRTAARWILSSYSCKISATSLPQHLQLEFSGRKVQNPKSSLHVQNLKQPSCSTSNFGRSHFIIQTFSRLPMQISRSWLRWGLIVRTTDSLTVS